MTDFNKLIVANGDDGFVNGTTFYNALDYCSIGEASLVTNAFLRFQNITIPKDAVINSAIIRVRANYADSGTVCNVNIYIEAADNPAAPSSTGDYNGRTMGSAVAWSGIGSWSAESDYDSVDFTSILQTHVQRTGWASGQALNIFLKNNGSTPAARRRFKARDLTTVYCAELRVVYGEVQGSVTDDLEISDTVDVLGPVDAPVADSLSIDDQIVAQGGSTFATAADNITIDDLVEALGPVPAGVDDDLTIDDSVHGGFEIQGAVSDDISMGDDLTVGFEYQGPVSDDLVMDDSADGFLWSEWLRENLGKYAIKYYVTLTGDADNESDQVLPFASFQSTKRNGAATYLSVIVPGFQYSSAITARSNGDLKVDMAYLIDGVESFREMIIEVDLEAIRTDEGPRKRSLTLSGSRVVDYAVSLITLENPIYKNTSDGKIRYRFLHADPWLNAGDTVRCRGDEFVVDYITYTISDRFKQMEISET